MHGTPPTPDKGLERAMAAPLVRGTIDVWGNGAAVLLAGLVIDASGAPMIPSRRTISGAAGSRYYVTAAVPQSAKSGERIPAARLDRGIIGVLQRVGLLAAVWERQDLIAILRRVVVHRDCLVLQLHRRPCLNIWRDKNPELRRSAKGNVLGEMEVLLSQGEEFTEVGHVLCLKIPRYTNNRGARGRNVLATASAGMRR